MAKILVADDEINILEAIRDILESAGHEVVSVYDGQEALEKIHAQKFDVALIDVMMPKLDGYHLATLVNGTPNKPKLIIVTARDFDADKSAIYASGVDAFLSKPFSNKELLEVVSTLLNPPA
jgi:CheY-like chemotaxis protein